MRTGDYQTPAKVTQYFLKEYDDKAVLMNDKTQQDDDEQQQQNCDCWKCRRDEQFRLQANAMPLQETSETLAALFHSTQTTPQSLSTDDFCVKRSLVLQHARQFTTCASCLNAVRTLRLQDHPLLEEGDGGDLRVRPIHTETILSTSRVLSLLSTSGWNCKALQPQSSKKKKSIRCRAYQKTRNHVDASDWRKVWDAAPAKFKERVATMVPADLEQFTKDHVEFVRFCRRCSANVKEGFHLLMQKDNPNFKLPEGYRTDLFAPLHVVPAARDRDSNDASDSTRVVCDVSSVPELINYHTTELVKDEMRHANNEEARCAVCLDLVQQEIRSVVGSLLLWRIRSGWHPFLAEEQSIDLICRVALTCIRGNVAASLQSQLPNVDVPNVVQTNNKKKKKRRNKRNKKGKGKQKQSNRQVVGFESFSDAKEAELLKSMGWSSLESDGTAAEACVKGRKKNETPIGLDSVCNVDVEQLDRDFDFDLGLSKEELETIKTKLMDTKKERDQQRVALKQAWETCQSSCCKSTKHGKRAGDVCSSKNRTFLCA